MKNILIVVPAGLATGGTELLHQLCSCLNDNNIEAMIGYCISDTQGHIQWCGQKEVTKGYQDYNIKIIDTEKYVITENDIVVIPETALEMLPLLENNLTFIWWLSVDNYLRCMRKDIINFAPVKFKDKPNIIHLVQSWYAYRFLVKSAEIDEDKIYWLSDYINDSFFEKPFEISVKKNQIAYNPAKGYENIKKLIEDTPDIDWVPLVNMTHLQVCNTLQMSKIYIDFGNHPGKDRIPREAAISGCCVITNRLGAADYYEDVPIPNEYKFADIINSEAEIINLIKDIFDNYEVHLKDFDYYRQKISQEKGEFIVDATQTFRQFIKE